MSELSAARSLRLPAGVAIDRVVLCVFLLIAGWLRFHDLTAQSLWWDEVMSLRQARLGFGDLLAATAEDNYPPLHNLMLHGAMRLFGATELAVRLPSAIMGTLTVAAVYWVGTMAAGRRAGLIAAGLLAVSGFHVWYSQEARMYALLALVATVFAGCVLAWVRSKRWYWLAAGVVAATALLYTHVYGALTWFAICAGALVVLDVRRRFVFVAVQVLPVVFFAPWLLILMGRSGEIGTAGFWIPPITPWGLFQLVVQLASGPFMLAAIAVGLRLAVKAPRSDGLPVLVAWAVVPLVLGVAVSLAVTPVLLSRYVIGSLPALLVVAGIGLALASRLTLAVVGVAAMTGLLVYAPSVRDDFRAVAAALRTTLMPGDCLVMIPEAAFALGYYMPEPVPCLEAARRFADIRFDVTPKRILVLATMDADLPGIAALGTETEARAFGPTRLITVVPR